MQCLCNAPGQRTMMTAPAAVALGWLKRRKPRAGAPLLSPEGSSRGTAWWTCMASSGRPLASRGLLRSSLRSALTGSSGPRRPPSLMGWSSRLRRPCGQGPPRAHHANTGSKPPRPRGRPAGREPRSRAERLPRPDTQRAPQMHRTHEVTGSSPASSIGPCSPPESGPGPSAVQPAGSSAGARMHTTRKRNSARRPNRVLGRHPRLVLELVDHMPEIVSASRASCPILGRCASLSSASLTKPSADGARWIVHASGAEGRRIGGGGALAAFTLQVGRATLQRR
jgi:hypothetical protein